MNVHSLKQKRKTCDKYRENYATRKAENVTDCLFNLAASVAAYE